MAAWDLKQAKYLRFAIFSAKLKPSKLELLRNGSFPIDFWHGDGLGAFRIHAIPDVLLPSFGDFSRWAGCCGCRATLRPLTGRLAFRQVGNRRWGRLLAPLMRLCLLSLDILARLGFGRIIAPFFPYLVVELRPMS